MSVSRRFRVIKENGQVQIHGFIAETSNIRAIDEMLDDVNHVDCSGLQGASWNGLIQFVAHLRASGKVFHFLQLPHSMYRTLRLFPDVEDFLHLEQFEIATFAGRQPEQVSYKLMTQQQLADELKRNYFFIYPEGDQLVQGLARYCSPGDSVLSPSSQVSSWAEENIQDFLFWFDYLNFCDSTLFLAEDIVQTTIRSLSAIVDEINVTSSGMEQACDLIDKPVEESIKTAVEEYQSQCQPVLDQLSDLVSQYVAQSDLRLRQLQAGVQLRAIKDKASFYEHVKGYSDFVLSIQQRLGEIENIGTDVGGAIFSLAKADIYKKIIFAVSDDQITPELLGEIRDVLEIMDPLSEDSWEDTKEEIEELLAYADNHIGNSIMIVQGFDLLRQVFEHRIAEFTLVSQFLEQGASDLGQLRTDVFTKVRKKLVTDQEKYSCSFFIPDARHEPDQQAEDSKNPGDVMLF